MSQMQATGAAGSGDGTIVDGVSSSIKATVLDLASANPLTVAITDAAGDQITSFGGGTQYTEGDTDASITGTAVMWEDTGDTLRAVSATKPLPVSADTELPAAAALADDTANPTTTSVGALLMGYDNATSQWDRLRSSSIAADGASAHTQGVLDVMANGFLYNGASWDRARGDATDGQLVNLGANNDVTVSSSTLPTGAATSAKQDTIIGHVDGIEGLLTTIDADTGALAGAVDSFGHIIIGDINNDVDIQFYRATSDSNLSNIITETEVNGGTASRSNGMATFATTTTASSRAKGVSLVPVVYTAGAEVYMIFTAAFPTATGGTSSYRRIGLYNDLTDGFFIGYETTGTFGVTTLKGGAMTTTLKASFSVDTLVGGAGSLFTRNGTPEAIDLTKLNVFRIRFGWVGSAPIKFEVLAPDGNWVNFHTIKQPNLAELPSINTADLYATCDVATGTSGNAQSILSNCWGAGTTQKLRKLTDTLTNNTLAGLTRSVLTGVTTGGGGGFVNVKVSPSGALAADVTGTVTVSSGAITETNSAAIAASASVLDDWDETNRAAVNTIAGQVGVQGASGAVTALTQRVVLATDVALPAGTNAIGKLAANSGVDIGDVDITSIAAGTNAIGRVGHDITGMGHGVTTVTTAGTDVALAGSTACKRVVIQAQTDNTSGIAVGTSGVDATVATGTGIYLNPGDAFEIEIDNLADIFIDSLVNGEGVRYTYFT